jgi:hypothetical protein
MPRSLFVGLFWLLASCSTPPPVTHDVPLPKEDINQIRRLVAQRADIRKPILRIFADRADHALVDSGREGYVGAVFHSFAVAKRHGNWQIDSNIEEEHVIAVGH